MTTPHVLEIAGGQTTRQTLAQAADTVHRKTIARNARHRRRPGTQHGPRSSGVSALSGLPRRPCSPRPRGPGSQAAPEHVRGRLIDGGRSAATTHDARPRPARPSRSGTPTPHLALVPLATPTTAPSTHQPLQTTQPHHRSCPTIRKSTVAVLGRGRAAASSPGRTARRPGPFSDQ